MAKQVAKEPLEVLTRELQSLLEQIETLGESADVRAKGKALKALGEISGQLQKVTANLDPILRPDSVFDPSSPETIGRIIALTMVAQKRHPLSIIPEFYGSGIYAIYYTGSYDAYEQLAHSEHPIYVGKADPNDQTAPDPVAQGVKLSARMREHAKNIGKATTTLSLSDFECRFLIVKSGLQSSAEKYLIDFFKPIWNSETKICFGLGKHGDSATTRVNKRSPWDTLHPGRAWADKTAADQKPSDQIKKEISDHFTKHPPYKDSHKIFDLFNEEMRQLSTEHFYTMEGEIVVIPESPTPEQADLLD